ncbi:hypothetical protein AND_010411 [Anopheles darlingi]|uniref:Uncharacterized protein n=1 Tax=Anopheles darlingi TaxID=43151 RepID=W5J3X3_ANODA|nr:hypothetical protein AND_010411 [Anopheles darlingi]
MTTDELTMRFDYGSFQKVTPPHLDASSIYRPISSVEVTETKDDDRLRYPFVTNKHKLFPRTWYGGLRCPFGMIFKKK